MKILLKDFKWSNRRMTDQEEKLERNCSNLQSVYKLVHYYYWGKTFKENTDHNIFVSLSTKRNKIFGQSTTDYCRTH